MCYAIKPWYAARWETVEPEESVYDDSGLDSELDSEIDNEPSNNELIDIEFGAEYE